MTDEKILVLDFGGQYNQLIARRVRECSVYAEVHPYTMTLDQIKEMAPKGIIFTGGPSYCSAYRSELDVFGHVRRDLGRPCHRKNGDDVTHPADFGAHGKPAGKRTNAAFA